MCFCFLFFLRLFVYSLIYLAICLCPIFVFLLFTCIRFFFYFISRANRHTKFKKWVCQRLVCEFAKDSLPLTFQDVNLKMLSSSMKFSENRYEAFILLIICLQSNFFVVRTVCCCQKLIVLYKEILK